MRSMNEGGPDSGDDMGDEGVPEPVEPKIAPPEVEYQVDTLNGEPLYRVIRAVLFGLRLA